MGKKNFISMYSLETFSEEKIKISDDSELIVQKIRISRNSEFIVVGQQTVKGDFLTVLKDKKNSEVFASEIPKFGLSSSGDNLVYINNNEEGKGSLAGLCFTGYYYDGDVCQACESSCSFCESGEGECYGCRDGHYLKDNTCQKCMLGCLNCKDSDTCS